jgi:hypothetical protein
MHVEISQRVLSSRCAVSWLYRRLPLVECRTLRYQRLLMLFSRVLTPIVGFETSFFATRVIKHLLTFVCGNVGDTSALTAHFSHLRMWRVRETYWVDPLARPSGLR